MSLSIGSRKSVARSVVQLAVVAAVAVAVLNSKDIQRYLKIRSM